MHSIPKSKDISALKELPLASMHKKLNDFHKKFTMFKKRNPQTKEKQDLKEKLKKILEIFLMKCIVVTSEDIVKKKWFQYKRQKIETR